jgi:tetratricopeptide (TPR) repeat protein
LREEAGDLEAALADYSEAVRLLPTSARGVARRGSLLLEMHRLDEALADLDAAIRLDPKDSHSHNQRATVLYLKGDRAGALSDHREALELDPNNLSSLNGLAWLHAVSPEAPMRDGAKAVELATSACERTAWKVPGFLDTLAAAHAECGRFDEAIRLLEQALLLPGDGHTDEYRSRIALYRERQPYRIA